MLIEDRGAPTATLRELLQQQTKPVRAGVLFPFKREGLPTRTTSVLQTRASQC